MTVYVSSQGLGTKAWGIAAVIGVHALAGYVLISGLGTRVVETMMDPIIAEVIEEVPPPPDEPPPPPPPQLDAPPPPRIPLPEIVFDNPPPPAPTAVQAVQAGEPVENVIAPPAPPARPATRVQPQFRRAGQIPDYPEASRRLEETGTTTLQICVDVEGRVSSAEVTDTSGSTRLDRAAVSWVERQRFNPGTVGGQPEAMCRSLPIEWVLE